MARETESERSMRLDGTMRGIIITYGIAGYGWLMSLGKHSPVAQTNASSLFVIGLAIQLVVVLVKVLTKNRDIAPQAIYIAELIADGVTVAMFAVATLRAIMPMTLPDV